jgi:hypothetical protein
MALGVHTGSGKPAELLRRNVGAVADAFGAPAIVGAVQKYKTEEFQQHKKGGSACPYTIG